MTGYLDYFFGGGQFLSLITVAVVWCGFAALGGRIAGPNRIREADPLFGWALVNLVFTMGGVFTPLSFTAIAVAVGLAAAVAGVVAVRRDGGLLPAPALKLYALGLPLLLMTSAMAASQWDEFSHWLPAIRFLLETDAFPGLGNPLTGASYPAYPYTWPLVSYLTGRLGGGLIENSGGIVNILLLFTFGLLAVRLILHGLNRDGKEASPGWGLLALGGLVATLFNPAFAQKVVLTAYADAASAAAMGSAAVLGWLMLEALADGRAREARRLSWQTGLVLLLLVNLKQANLVLTVILLGALAVVILLDPAIRVRESLRLLPGLVLPPLLIYATWRYHVVTELSGQEWQLRPLSEWSFAIIPQVLWKMLTVLAKKGAYLTVMAIAAGFAIRGLWRCRTGFDRLAILTGVAFVGYNAFLFFTYIAAFSEFDALRVASLWRYNMHLGLVGVAFAVYGLAILWRRHLPPRLKGTPFSWVAVVLILAAPVVFAKKIRFDLEQPKPHYRTVAKELAPFLPEGSRYFVLDPRGSGESAVITRFDLGPGRMLSGKLAAFDAITAEVVRSVLGRDFEYLLVHSLSPVVSQGLGMDLDGGASHLLVRDGAGWRIVNSWPHPANPR